MQTTADFFSVISEMQDIGDKICEHSSLETLARGLLRTDRACRDAARRRLSLVLPRLRPLLAAPFRLKEADLLDYNNVLSFLPPLTPSDVDALSAACALSLAHSCMHQT